MKRKVQVWIGTRENQEVMIFKLVESRGGGWHPITAGVEKGESFFEAAKRETLEETGISEDAGTWVDLEHSNVFDGRYGKSIEHAFGFILTSRNISIHLEPSELTEFKWVSFEDAKQSLGFEPQRRALELFLCYLLKDEGPPSPR